MITFTDDKDGRLQCSGCGHVIETRDARAVWGKPHFCSGCHRKGIVRRGDYPRRGTLLLAFGGALE